MATLTEKIAYNRNQAKAFGWDPTWFGCDEFDGKLLDAIALFQAQEGLSPDGMCGPATYRRVRTRRESEQEYEETRTQSSSFKNQTIYYNGKPCAIHWDKVRLWTDPGGLALTKGYSDGPPVGSAKGRQTQFFVTHWDVCLNSKSCAKVLDQRGISVQFCIDNDGTIYQLLDAVHACWQAGSRLWNSRSIGVEVSDAYYPKYQRWYQRNKFGPRPIWEGARVHGRELDPFLGFYFIQEDALAALWEAVSRMCDIPLALPETTNGVDPECERGDFQGFCNHYHLTQKKIDCAGLDNQKILQKALAIREEHYGNGKD